MFEGKCAVLAAHCGIFGGSELELGQLRPFFLGWPMKHRECRAQARTSVRTKRKRPRTTK